MSCYLPYLVTLTGRRQLSDSFVRITLAAPELATVSPTLLDQRVKLVLGEAKDLAVLVASDDWFTGWRQLASSGRAAMRTYTLSGRRPDRGEVDIDVVVHSDTAGPASTWAATADLGSRAVLVAASEERDGHQDAGVAWRPGDAHDVVIVADETALVAATMIADSLAPEVTGCVVIEVPTQADIRPVATPSGVDVRWAVRARGERAHRLLPFPVEHDREDDDAEDLLWSEGEGHGSYLWVAGEASWVRSIRTAARAAGVPRESSAFMGYWRMGHAEM